MLPICVLKISGSFFGKFLQSVREISSFLHFIGQIPTNSVIFTFYLTLLEISRNPIGNLELHTVKKNCFQKIYENLEAAARKKSADSIKYFPENLSKIP